LRTAVEEDYMSGMRALLMHPPGKHEVWPDSIYASSLQPLCALNEHVSKLLTLLAQAGAGDAAACGP
jgi:hypothetical protein